MLDRRKFLKSMAIAGVASTLPQTPVSAIVSKNKKNAKPNSDMIWASLLHLSTNMWEDHPYIDLPNISENVYKDDFKYKTCDEASAWGLRAYRPFLVFEETTWNLALQNLVDSGMNMVLIDLGDAVRYHSHPEIAVKNAWSVDKLRAELTKIRKMGLEPIPKLNFAASHDTWLGEYSRMVSTKKYYQVCEDLISEVIDIFDSPRYFHLGMDEETARHQRTYDYVLIRQRDLWWNDLYFYINQTEKKGVRPWIWSDYGWHYSDVFFRKMPKSVLQSNWYYNHQFDLENMTGDRKTYLKFYNDLDAHGYDQVPTGSNWDNDMNLENTVEYCKRNINPARLQGFLATSWVPTLDVCLNKQKEAIAQLQKAKIKLYK